MIEGESGLLAVCESDTGNVPEYFPSKRLVLWPNGARALMFSAEEPDALRGPQCDAWWADELAAWQYLEATWDQLQFGARLGDHVRGIVTTTPRPLPQIKELLTRDDVVVTRGSTYDNVSNLAPSAIATFRRKYEGTRLGRQELYAEVIDDVEGAIWSREMIDKARITDRTAKQVAATLQRIFVSVDPSGSSGVSGDEIGIVTAGIDQREETHVLADDTLLASPQQWAEAAVTAYYEWSADAIIAEGNFGGEMVRHTIHTVDQNVPVIIVHASRGKKQRAEPVVARYEQGRVHHVGHFAKLEDEMCTWVPDESKWSPNRMDALVWADNELTKRKARWGIA